MKKEDLIKAAENINEVMGFEDTPPPLKKDPEKIQEWIIEALKELRSDDTFEEGTFEVLREMNLEEVEFDEKVTGYLQKFGIWIEEEESIKDEEKQPKKVEPEDPEEVGEPNLEDLVKGVRKLKDLKELAKSYDEFKSVRSSLTKYNKVSDLKIAMLTMLSGEDPEKETEEKIPTKEVKSKPESVKKQTRASVFAEIFNEGIPRSMKEIEQEMISRYSTDSVAGARTFTSLYTQILLELGFLEKDKNGKLVKAI